MIRQFTTINHRWKERKKRAETGPKPFFRFLRRFFRKKLLRGRLLQAARFNRVLQSSLFYYFYFRDEEETEFFSFFSISLRFRYFEEDCAKILSRESPFWRTDYSRKFYSIFLFIPDFLPIFLSFFTIVQIQGGIIKEIDFSKEIPREIPTTNRHFCATQKAKFHVSYLYGSLQFSSTSPHYEMKRQTHSTIWRASSSNFLGQEFSFCQRK